MKGKSLLLLVLSLFLVLGLGGGIGGLWAKEPAPPRRPMAQGVPAEFTYQGRLMEDSTPVNDTCDFQFSLYDTELGGDPLHTVEKLGVEVSDGLFTVQLDFQYYLDGARWLEVGVKCTGETLYATLSPRQPLTSAPYALLAGEAFDLACTGCVHTSAISNATILFEDIGDNGCSTKQIMRWNGSAWICVNDNYHDHWGANWGGTGTGLLLDSSLGTGLSARGTTYGVCGQSGSTSGQGVYGWATATSGTTYGVYGKSNSSSGRGVYGEAPDTGVYGKSTSGLGGTGVYGLAGGAGASYGVHGESTSSVGYGVYGQSPYYGVYGYATGLSDASYGVWGQSRSASGYGVYAYNSSSGVGLYARSVSGNPIEAYGNIYGDREFYVSNAGEVYADGSFHPSGADLADMMPAVEELEPGDVLVIGLDGKLTRSTVAYQPTVVGVYSTKPGFVGGSGDDEDLNGKVPLAIAGVVPVKASAENGPIRPGDLLVASSTPGHAMRADPNPPVGTAIGKALESLDSGTGLIQMLVMLQ